MSSERDIRPREAHDERNASLPVLRGWWAELSPAAKILIPMTGAVLLVVTGSSLPPLVL